MDHERVGNTGGPRKRGTGKVSTLDNAKQTTSKVSNAIAYENFAHRVAKAELGEDEGRLAADIATLRWEIKNDLFQVHKKNCSGIG